MEESFTSLTIFIQKCSYLCAHCITSTRFLHFLKERESCWVLYLLWHLQMFIELNKMFTILLSSFFRKQLTYISWFLKISLWVKNNLFTFCTHFIYQYGCFGIRCSTYTEMGKFIFQHWMHFGTTRTLKKILMFSIYSRINQNLSWSLLGRGAGMRFLFVSWVIFMLSHSWTIGLTPWLCGWIGQKMGSQTRPISASCTRSPASLTSPKEWFGACHQRRTE